MEKRIIIALVLAGFFAVSLHAEVVGKFSYHGSPEDLNGDTIVVSDTMVAMAENVKVETFLTLGDSISDTPSVFFIIDNSGSMSTNNPTDRSGNRFTVTSAFIDTLKNNFPMVEVGVAVFGTWLYFDPNDSTYFVRPTGRPPALDYGAYVPLLQLDRLYPEYGNRTGHNILKGILDTTRRGSGTNQYVDLNYRPTNTVLQGDYTNINAGFDAARDAFDFSFNTNRKSKQFIIFLSDGVANRPSTGDDPQRFQDGDSVPTTFTVYFTSGGGVPTSIATMTTNIQNNGYSTSNPRSTYWGFQNTGFQQLMDLLMDSVFTVIATNSLGRPTRISIGSKTEINWGIDSSFAFDNLFPLKGQITPFTYVINYRLTKAGRLVGDTTHVVNFCVRTSPGATMNPALYDITYWDRDMEFRYGGSPVALITGAMPSIELRFGCSPGTADHHYTNVMVDVMNSSSAVLDREIFLLNRVGATDSFSITFDRAVSASPVASNGILEHATPDDTIIAVFRNSESPRLPLDTLLISCPVHIDPATLGALLDSAVTRDSDGDGLIDRIDLYFNKTVVIDSDSTGCFTITHNNGFDTLSADSIVQLSSSSYSVIIKVDTAATVPQTGWKPVISIDGLAGVENVSGFLAADGCPPVVWRAVKRIVNQDLCLDTVTVYLSEKISGSGGGTFSVLNPPSSAFAAWTQDSSGTFIVDTVLSGITSFARIVNDSILVFSMFKSAGGCLDLDLDNWINLQWQTPVLFDTSDNAPSSNNRKVRIIIEGSAVKVDIPSNPAGPSSRYVAPGVLEFKNMPEAVNWVSGINISGGVVVQIRGLEIPEVDKDKVSGYMAIYDAAGNTVNWASDPSIFDGPAPGRDYVLYWNGFNHQGMAVSPGVYRMVIAVKYTKSSGIKNIRKAVKIGMRRY